MELEQFARLVGELTEIRKQLERIANAIENKPKTALRPGQRQK
jgi:hypothetical protein